jgi:hypothetical protein
MGIEKLVNTTQRNPKPKNIYKLPQTQKLAQENPKP